MTNPRTEIQITPEPLVDSELVAEGCGAVVEFSGVVRGIENGKPIAGLVYEAYQPMASMEMERLIRELQEQFPCDHIRVRHRVGVIPVGEKAIILQVASTHRAAAFSFVTAFMDRLKQDVPIWKTGAQPAPIPVP